MDPCGTLAIIVLGEVILLFYNYFLPHIESRELLEKPWAFSFAKRRLHQKPLVESYILRRCIPLYQ